MRWQAFPTLAVAVLACGCAMLRPPPLEVGQTEAQVLAIMGPPTARHALPGGTTRLEFATGPFGRFTWMVDLHPDGRSRAVRQVLTYENLYELQPRAPGMTVSRLLQEIGTPGERMGVRMGEVWSWRYPTYECLWWQVTVGRDGRVIDAGFGPDWMCDPDDRVALIGPRR